MSSHLTQRDYEGFLKLRITREILDRAHVSRVTRDEAESQFGIKLDCVGGILFPYYLPSNGMTHPAPVAYCVRQDSPPRDSSGKEERKYVCVAGSRQHPYIAPVNRDWLEDHSCPAIIVEAQKSALGILRWCEDNNRRLIPVGINGCYGWRGSVGITTTANGERVPEKDILGSLENICNGRRCYILLDANASSNLKVQHARDRLANRLLAGITTDVRILSLPPAITAPFYNGPDDFIAAFGDQCFHEVFESAQQRRALVAENEFAEPAAFPDMPEAVLDGRLGEICQQEMKDFPRAYAYTALLVAAGTVVPNSPQPYVHANLYGGLVGPVGSGKSAAISTVYSILDLKPPTLVDVMSGSAEGLIQHIGTGGAQRLLSPDELSHLLAKAAIDRASFPYILNRAYTDNSFSIIASGRKEIAYNAVLSVLGGIVEDAFQHNFSHITTGGLYDRFMFGLCPTNFQYSFRPWEGAVTEINPRAVTIHGDVWAVKDEWNKADPTLGRVVENAIRAAVICAAWDGREVLRAADLEPARAFAEYQTRVRTILRPNPGENLDAKCAFAIMQVVTNSKQALSLRSVYRKIHAERFGPGAFARAVKGLEFNGDLKLQGKGLIRAEEASQ